MEEKDIKMDEQDIKQQGINRRTFLKGAGTGLAAFAASSVLRPIPTIAEDTGEPNDVLNTDEVWRGNYKVDMNNVKPIPTVDPPEKYDYETDVLIFGYGMGGTSAALTVVNNGAKLMVLEKSTRHNWNEHAGIHTVGMLGIKEWLDYHGIPEWNIEQIDAQLDRIFPDGMSVSDREASRINMLAGVEAFEQVRALGKGCTFEMVEIFPEWKGFPTMVPTHEGDIEGGSIYYPWQNKYLAVENRIHDYVESKGGQVLWGTWATNLIADETGRIVGVKAADVDGKVIYVKAKATINCVGGMGANYDMISYYGYGTELSGCHMGSLTNDGSGMRMCQGAGASVRGLPRYGANAEGGLDCMKWNLPWNMPHDNAVTRAAGLFDRQFSAYTYAPIQLGRQPVLKTNKYGLRFENENADWDEKMWQALKQPEKVFYTFYDNKLEEIVEKLNERYGMCERFVTPNEYIFFADDDIRPMYDWREEVKDGIEKGYIVKADTLEELADKLGVNKENLLKTVERYNHFCETGVDEDYGKAAEFLFPVKDPPFYGMERTAAYLWMADGGIGCDPYGRVLNRKGEVIPGLFCGANDAKITDHQTMGNRMMKPTCGGADFAMSIGYLAGKTAAEEALS
ncbi:MAG: FAD-binding protein [Christensenellales bacterium]|jgi:fumarate reductase flavoprotein subunit